MQLILTPATGGQPVVIGIGSATQQGALNLAQIVSEDQPTDLFLIARSGVLMGQTYENLVNATGASAAGSLTAQLDAAISSINETLTGVQQAEVASGGISNGTLSLVTYGGQTLTVTGTVTGLPMVITDGQGNVLFEPLSALGEVLLPGMQVTVGNTGELAFVDPNSNKELFNFNMNTGVLTAAGGANINGALTATSGTMTNLTVTGALSAPAVPVMDNLGNVLFEALQTLSAVLLPGMQMNVGNSGELAFVDQLTSKELFNFNMATGVLTVAGNAYIGGNLVVGGTVSSSGSGSSSTFSTQDIANFNSLMQQYWTSVASSNQTSFQRPSNNLNLMLEQGESKVGGSQGVPALSTVRPGWSNALMLGLAAKSSNNVGNFFNPVGGSATLNPLVSVNLSGGALWTPATGKITGLTGVTLSGLSTAGGVTTGTITWVGQADPTTLLSTGSANNEFEMTGFVTGTANNASPAQNNHLTCIAVSNGTTRSIVYQDTTRYTVAVSGDAGPVEIALIQYDGGTGEDQIVQATWGFEKWWLDFRGLASDPTYRFISMNTANGGNTIAYFSKPSNSYSLILNAAGQIKSIGGSLALSTGVTDFYAEWGAADSSANTPYATVLPEMQAYRNNIFNDVAIGIFGQTLPPLWLSTVTGGKQLADGPDSNGVLSPVTSAGNDFFGLRPALGNWVPYAPEIYCVGANYWVTDHGTELTCNGMAVWGVKRAEVKARIFQYGWWKPTHAVKAVSRGSQALLGMFCPCPPIVALAPYVYNVASLQADLGCTFIDSYGTLTVSGYTVQPPYVVEFSLSRTWASATTPLASIKRNSNTITATVLGTIAGVGVGSWVTFAGVGGDTTLNGYIAATSVASSGGTQTIIGPCITPHPLVSGPVAPGANSVGVVTGATARLTEILKIGDAAHAGCASIADSDNWTPKSGFLLAYKGDGNGQDLGENIPTGAGNYLSAGLAPSLPNFVCNTVIPTIPG